LLISVANLAPVLKTRAVTSNSPGFTLIAVKAVLKFATPDVNKACGKFAAGVIDTGGQQ
jgi:hypothetical protein